MGASAFKSGLWLATSLNRNEQRMAFLAADGSGEMAFSGGVFDQKHLTGVDGANFTVACGDLHRRVEIDDVLAPWGRMPIAVVFADGASEDNTRGGNPF